MKRILGLDLGSASIGWAVIEENSEEVVDESAAAVNDVRCDKILGLGSRIIPLSVDETTQFAKGQAITKNADRTAKRSQRKGYDRYQLRRALLLEELSRLGMYDGQTLRFPKLDLWKLRAKSVKEQVSLKELGRVLCHLNQKRGYRSAKSDFADKKQTDYVRNIMEHYAELQAQGITIGQYFYDKLLADEAYRCKDTVFPREAYVEEFDAIIACQRQFYPHILTQEKIDRLRNYIIFYQRPLRSCKHLVAKCELERHDAERNGRIYNCGPRVAPRSSPLFQVCKIWESINNLNIHNKTNATLPISNEQKQSIFNFMNTHEKLKTADLKSILGIKSKEWQFGKAIGTGLQGNTTYCSIAKVLGGKYSELLSFELKTADGSMVDTETGELSRIIDDSFEREPLYRLWHALYSISDMDYLRTTLVKQFGISDDNTLTELCKLDFVKSGYGNKSARAIRKILPYLQEGKSYYEAKIAAGYDDTPLTKEENEERRLADYLQQIPKGELRQPVVEKILNQMVNVVNALMTEYGRFDEIRVELSRDLKQNREERELASKAMNRAKNENERIAKILKEEYNLTATRSRIIKYKLWEESKKSCIYCGHLVNVKEFLSGLGVEIEHIIPRTMRFDDSFSNKACACRKCNQEKSNRAAYDFMQSRGESEFNAYIERVNSLADEGQISKTKLKNLLTPADELPEDFIDRQLRESQYIAKKAKEMLQSVCRNVYSTSGSITDFIRRMWGWDNVLHDLNFERYRNAGLTYVPQIDQNPAEQERIVGWNKRLDHRHHAIDALTIACTKQGYIQRLNNLNSLKDVSFCAYSDENQDKTTKQRLTRLERYIAMQPHLSTAEVAQAVEEIAVSFKSGKRAASPGKRYIYRGGKRICKQEGILIPRGALNEESVYGRIRDSKTGKEEIVVKYKLSNITTKEDIASVVDEGIRTILRKRLEQYGNDPKKAFAEPVLDHQGRVIRSVRCRTGLNVVVPLRYDDNGNATAFVKTGNNHHVAIYEDENGKLQEHISTFWHAVERRKYGLPTIITRPYEVWERITDDMPQSFIDMLPPRQWQFRMSMQQNEMFVLGMSDEEYGDAMEAKDYAALSRHLYRVQKLSAGAYVFRQHTETQTDDKYPDENGVKKFQLLVSKRKGAVCWVSSLKSLKDLNPHKVYVTITGKISEI